MAKNRLVFSSPDRNSGIDTELDNSSSQSRDVFSPPRQYVSILKPDILKLPQASGHSPPINDDVVDVGANREEVAEVLIATPIQTNSLAKDERQMLFDEINNLRQEKEKLKEQLEKTVCLDYQSICNKDAETKYLSGLSSSVFLTVFSFLSQFMSGNRVRSIPIEKQFLISLIRLRLNVPFEYIGAGRCSIHCNANILEMDSPNEQETWFSG